MKVQATPVFIVVSLLFAALLLIGVAVSALEEGADNRIPGQYIVVFNDSIADPDAVEEELVGRVRAERFLSYRHALRGFSARLSPEAVVELEADPNVAFISEDRTVSIADTERTEREARSASVERRTKAERGADVEADRSAPTRRPDSSTEPTSSPAQVLPSGIDRINAENKANNGAGVH